MAGQESIVCSSVSEESPGTTLGRPFWHVSHYPPHVLPSVRREAGRDAENPGRKNSLQQEERCHLNHLSHLG